MSWPPLLVARIVKLHRKVSKMRHGPPPPLQVGHKVGSHKGYFCAFLLGIGLKIGGNLSEDLFVFCSSPNFGRKIGLNLSEDHFFCSLPNFGRKIGLDLSRTISDSELCSSQIFWPPLFKILRTLLHMLDQLLIQLVTLCLLFC